MNKRLTWLAIVALVVGALAFGLRPTAEAATPANGSHNNPLANIPITGTVENGGTFRGSLDVVSFDAVTDHLVASGILKGTLYDASRHPIGNVEDVWVTDIPVSRQGTAEARPITCGILNLVLGPLDLNLLGLRVQLNQVHLVITAISGPGNLLGNLLCAIAHLLDGPGPLSQVAALLNRVIDLLGTIH
jgi:hypothetical protein